MTCTHLEIFVVGLVTFELTLRTAVLSAQPLEERSHHLGAAEAFEARTNVFMVPLQSTDLQDSDKRNDGDRKGADESKDNTKFI